MNVTSANVFRRLGPEFVDMLFDYLPTNDLCSSALVCNEWACIVAENSLLLRSIAVFEPKDLQRRAYPMVSEFHKLSTP